MKANRKSLNREDEAVSPVIAVILMVAITVVLAATVYVWVSGFGSNSNSSPAHTMSLVSAGAVTGSELPDDVGNINDVHYKKYTISSASPALTYEDMTLTVGGTTFAFTDPAAACTLAHTVATASTHFLWGACAGGADRTATSAVRAGDVITVSCYTADANCLNDKDLLFLDTESNSIMVSLKIR